LLLGIHAQFLQVVLQKRKEQRMFPGRIGERVSAIPNRVVSKALIKKENSEHRYEGRGGVDLGFLGNKLEVSAPLLGNCGHQTMSCD
jgi:hypothetical protein